MGAQPKLGRAQEDQVVKLLEGGATMAIAARGVGIDRSNLYRHMERRPAFAARVQEAKDLCDDQVESEMYLIATGRKSSVSKGQITAMIFWLKNRRPKQWRDAHAVAIENPDGTPIVDTAELVRMASMFVSGGV